MPQQNTDKKQCQLILAEDKSQLRKKIFFFLFSSLVEDLIKPTTKVNKRKEKKKHVS